MPIDIGNLWEQVLHLTKQEIDSWIWTQTLGTKTLPISLVNDTLTLGVTNSYVKTFIEANEMVINPLRKAVQQVSSIREITIKIIILGEKQGSDSSDDGTDCSGSSSISPAMPSNTTETSVLSTNSIPTSVDTANVTQTISSSTDVNFPPYDEFISDSEEGTNATFTNDTMGSNTDVMNGDTLVNNSPSENDIINVNSYQSTAKSQIEEDIPKGMMKPIVTPPVYLERSNTISDPYAGSINLTVQNPVEPKNNKPKQTVLDMEYDDVNIVINPDYTFDNFVVGNSNRMAFSAAMYVAEHPAQNYNPFFLYGNSGLGKTHLMHAIANRIRERRPDLKVLCMTSENFLNAFVDYVRTGRGRTFRSQYRTVDILMVDDIQFIQDKHYVGTQNEFFHTFNTLLEDHKQIILTSDTLPKDLDQMTDRLKTRFQSGFLGIIEPPDMELRIAILKDMLDKMEQLEGRKVPISNEILNYVASCFQKNVRELQGAFKSIVERAISENFHRAIDVNFVKEILSYHISQMPTNIITIEGIQETVCKHYGIKLEQLKSKKKTKDIAFPRQVAMYLSRELTNVSYVQIGTSFGKDHSTIMHAYERIASQIEKDEGTATAIKELIAKIRG